MQCLPQPVATHWQEHMQPKSQPYPGPCLPRPLPQPLDAASQLHAVLLAERCAELGICADLTDSLPAAPHNW